jgi:hypothetical protein
MIPVDQEAFDARLILPEGVSVYINAPSAALLLDAVGRLRPVASVTKRTPRGSTAEHAAADHIPGEKNRNGDPEGKPQAGAVTDPAGAPASTITAQSAPSAAGPAAGDAGNASASTGTQASAQPAASGSAASAGDKRSDDELLKAVGERVNLLAKKSRELAKGELKKFKAIRNGQQTEFPVERGGELTREQRIAFLQNTESLVL